MNPTPRLLACLAALALSGCAGMNAGKIVASDGSSKTAVGYMADIRQAAGLAAAIPDSQLERAAEKQARLMARSKRMTHTTGFGKDFVSRMQENNIRGRASENIAHGRMPIGKVFAMWQASPLHRKNMLDPKIKRFGLASATAADGQRYWALVLAD